MSQVSKRKLDNKVYQRIFEIFVASLALADNKNKAGEFVNNLLTITEKVMLAKRISIAYLLSKGYSYEAISALLKVSVSTVWLVKTRVECSTKPYEKFLKELVNKEDVGTYGIFEVLEDLFPPPRGTNWKEVRRKQWKERREKEKAF